MVRTVGVEEELLLVGPVDGKPAAIGAEVVSTAELLAAPDAQIDHEFKQEQAEIASSPATSLDAVRAELVELRAGVAQAARAEGGLAVAIATSPVKVRPHQTEDERYERMNHEFGLLSRQQLTCGQHMHVEIGSRAEGVGVLDRIQIWLPVLAALASNSPFWQGADTGYASYRTVLWNLWPSAGPTARFDTVAEYDRQVRELVATGAALDDGMVYFAARLSARYPTVEIRVADVCTDVDDAITIAALCRALVDTAANEWRDDIDPPSATAALLRAMGWRAARFGVIGPLFDARNGDLVDGWQLVDGLLAHVSSALTANGDADRVTTALERLRRSGTGADRQRAAASGSAGLTAVVLDAAARTIAS